MKPGDIVYFGQEIKDFCSGTSVDLEGEFVIQSFSMFDSNKVNVFKKSDPSISYVVGIKDLVITSGIDPFAEIGIVPKPCQHEFVNYVGFTDSFQYCKHCDEKRK